MVARTAFKGALGDLLGTQVQRAGHGFSDRIRLRAHRTRLEQGRAGSTLELIDERAKAWAASEAGWLVTEVDAYTDEQVQAIVARATAASQTAPSVAGLRDLLEQEFALSNTFSADRAALIATTELRAAQTAGFVIGAKDAGIKRVLFTASNNEEECEVCQALDGNEYDIGEVPDDELPPVHPRCVCRLVPIADFGDNEDA